MIWNFVLHIVAGVIGNQVFTWAGGGILTCLGVTAVVQGVDMFRVYHKTVKRIRMQPPEVQEETMTTFKKRMPYTFPQLYFVKIIGFGLLTLVTASFTRAIIQ